MNQRLFILGPDARMATEWARWKRIKRFAPVDPGGAVFRDVPNPYVVTLAGWTDYRTPEQVRAVRATLRRLGVRWIRADDDDALAAWQPRPQEAM